MYSEPPVKIPYLDWTIDRWKIGVILALFIGLAIASVARPPELDAVKLPTATELPEVAEADRSAPAVGTDAPAPPQDRGRALIIPGAVTPADTLRLPLTLASFGPNAVVPPNSVLALVGTAAAGSSIKVLDQVVPRSSSGDLSPGGAENQVLGLATTNANGLWRLALAEPLGTGQHILTLHELGPQDELTGVSAPTVVTVLAPGEQGPLSLATPTIRSPGLGTRLTPGTVEFTGSGLPGMLVRLHLNGNFVAEALVTTQEEWLMQPEGALAPGVYEARAMALNPQGDVLAESAPVIFVVMDEPVQSSLPLTLPAPTLPLTISSLAYGDRRRTTLMINGTATPHAVVAVWWDGQPLKVVNAAMDGHWALAVEDFGVFGDEVQFEVRSSFGERVRTDTQLQRPVLTDLPMRPRLISPRAGEILTNPRPLLLGLAQPMTEVAILVNREVVGQVQADVDGGWSFRVIEPLPNGAVTLAAGFLADLLPERQASPIVVMVMPQHKLLASRTPLTTGQRPPAKFYFNFSTTVGP